jgi:hypothetical protein
MLYSSGWQALLEQYKNDSNVKTLLRAIHDAFNFTHQEDILYINPSRRNPNRHKFLLSCCRMFVVAATLSNRMQSTRSSVRRHRYLLHWLL